MYLWAQRFGIASSRVVTDLGLIYLEINQFKLAYTSTCQSIGLKTLKKAELHYNKTKSTLS
jgi:hypothetical protein